MKILLALLAAAFAPLQGPNADVGRIEPGDTLIRVARGQEFRLIPEVNLVKSSAGEVVVRIRSPRGPLLQTPVSTAEWTRFTAQRERAFRSRDEAVLIESYCATGFYTYVEASTVSIAEVRTAGGCHPDPGERDVEKFAADLTEFAMGKFAQCRSPDATPLRQRLAGCFNERF
jgi:hypothetical protein